MAAASDHRRTLAGRAAVQEALALTEHDLDPRRGSLLVRQRQGRPSPRGRDDERGWEQVRPWLIARAELPPGPLFCIIDGPTRGRPWSGASVRREFRAVAARAGVRRRFAPHQLRHAHALELAREGVPLNIIQRQLGHTNLGTTSIYLQGIDPRRSSPRPCAACTDDVGHRRAPSSEPASNAGAPRRSRFPRTKEACTPALRVRARRPQRASRSVGGETEPRRKPASTRAPRPRRSADCATTRVRAPARPVRLSVLPTSAKKNGWLPRARVRDRWGCGARAPGPRRSAQPGNGMPKAAVAASHHTSLWNAGCPPRSRTTSTPRNSPFASNETK